jgi:hypothetical protein
MKSFLQRLASAFGGSSNQSANGRPETRPVTEADKALAFNAVMGMAKQVRREADMDAARGHEPVVVRLAPQIPIRAHEPARSWLGGEPAMPAHVAWPEIKGRRAVFLAQICCADLPAALWDALGPRKGWLAFFVHAEDYAMQVLHFMEMGPSRPGPALDDESWFNPAGGLKHAKIPHAARRAFPRWPVDIVTVTPGGPDPRIGGDGDATYKLYKKGYDLASPEHQPFDWASALAMLDIAEEQISKRREGVGKFPETLPAQMHSVLQKLKDAEQTPESPANLERLRNKAHDLPILIEATTKAGQMMLAAASQFEAVATGVRERAARAPFSSDVIAPIMESLRAIEWMHVHRGIDKQRGQGAEDIQCKVLPLTVHDPDAAFWVHNFETLRFDWAKHAYCQSPASLPAAVRAHYEALWRDLAPHEMAGMGHVPFDYVHEFDADSEITLIELPSSDLLSWMFGDVNNLVVTMKKADLAAGTFNALKVQVSN